MIRKLKTVQWFHLPLAVPAFAVIGNAIGIDLILFFLCYGLLVAFLYYASIREAWRAQQEPTLNDLLVARGILLRAYNKRRIGLHSFISGEMFLIRAMMEKREDYLESIRGTARIERVAHNGKERVIRA